MICQSCGTEIRWDGDESLRGSKAEGTTYPANTVGLVGWIHTGPVSFSECPGPTPWARQTTMEGVR